jgi:hypothetical protein
MRWVCYEDRTHKSIMMLMLLRRSWDYRPPCCRGCPIPDQRPGHTLHRQLDTEASERARNYSCIDKLGFLPVSSVRKLRIISSGVIVECCRRYRRSSAGRSRAATRSSWRNPLRSGRLGSPAHWPAPFGHSDCCPCPAA